MLIVTLSRVTPPARVLILTLSRVTPPAGAHSHTISVNTASTGGGKRMKTDRRGLRSMFHYEAMMKQDKFKHLLAGIGIFSFQYTAFALNRTHRCSYSWSA